MGLNLFFLLLLKKSTNAANLMRLDLYLSMSFQIIEIPSAKFMQKLVQLAQMVCCATGLTVTNNCSKLCIWSQESCVGRLAVFLSAC